MALEMKELLKMIPQIGRVEWLGVRPSRREPLQMLESVQASMTGLTGDRFAGGERAKRQVTLIQHEHLIGMAAMLGKDSIDPALLRRNVVVSGINLQALKDQEFLIGHTVLYSTGNCPPCSRMEENLGPGGYHVMRGHGGITAYVVKPGNISLGDSVRLH